ncbi:MAG: hypothetical protein ACQR33_03960 [Candidatus Saccharibacteria bacterium]
MNILRHLLLRIARYFLPMTLFGFGLLLSMLLVLGNPALIKAAIKDSGLYNVMVDDVLLQNQTVVGTLPLSDPGIKQAIDSAFTPQILGQNGDNIIDGTYAWLQGKTTTPAFNVDLGPAKNAAAENVATYVANRFAALPTCSTSQLRTLQASGVVNDPYNLTCRPATLSAQSVHDSVASSILNSTEFVKNTAVTATSVQDTKGQPLYQRLSVIPTVYQWAVKGVFLLGIVALVALLGVIFLEITRRAGLKHAAWIGLWVGGVSTALALLAGFAGHYLTSAITKVSGSDQALQVKISDIVQTIVTDIRYWWLRIGVAEVVIAISLLIAVKVVRKRVQSPELPQAGRRGTTTLQDSNQPRIPFS